MLFLLSRDRMIWQTRQQLAQSHLKSRLLDNPIYKNFEARENIETLPRTKLKNMTELFSQTGFDLYAKVLCQELKKNPPESTLRCQIFMLFTCTNYSTNENVAKCSREWTLMTADLYSSVKSIVHHAARIKLRLVKKQEEKSTTQHKFQLQISTVPNKSLSK